MKSQQYTVCTYGASCSGRGSVVNLYRRCGQFFTAGEQSVGIILDELLLVKSSDSEQ